MIYFHKFKHFQVRMCSLWNQVALCLPQNTDCKRVLLLHYKSLGEKLAFETGKKIHRATNDCFSGLNIN